MKYKLLFIADPDNEAEYGDFGREDLPLVPNVSDRIRSRQLGSKTYRVVDRFFNYLDSRNNAEEDHCLIVLRIEELAADGASDEPDWDKRLASEFKQ